MKTTLILAAAAVLALIIAGSGCASLKEKSTAVASRADALRGETTGSVQSGTVAPNFMVGGGGTSISTSHAFTDSEKAVRSVAYTRSSSFWGSLFGLDLVSETLTYTGTIGETGTEAAAVIRAVKTARTNTDTERISK